MVPDGNPVMEAAGHIPTSPVTFVGPTLLTTGVAPRIPKPQAAPRARAPPPPGGGQAGEVVKLQVNLAASELPKVSCAPVVMVPL